MINGNMARFRKNRFFNQHPTSEAGFDQIGQRLPVILSFCRHYYIPGIEDSHGLTDRSIVPHAWPSADDAHIDPNVTQHRPVTGTNRTRADHYGAQGVGFRVTHRTLSGKSSAARARFSTHPAGAMFALGTDFP